MIIWIASYPRSGNTMLRMMLHQVFGGKTYTKYHSPSDPVSPDGTVRAATGKAPLPGPWEECYGPMSRDAALHFVKTHDGPEDEAKAIYLVRNGFAATRSYKSYLMDFGGQDFSLEQITLGEPQFGSWGGHLDEWDPLMRPNTLMLKYEDLVERPEQQIEKLSRFCGLAPKQDWVNEFEKFQALEPKMFRKGHVADPSAEFNEDQKQLFWAIHGDWMQTFEYRKDLPPADESCAILRRTVSQRLRSLQSELAANKTSTGSENKSWWGKLGLP